ncbi:hypothetical protein FRC12_011124, partial [Ceratobasidium sp. 428]
MTTSTSLLCQLSLFTFTPAMSLPDSNNTFAALPELPETRRQANTLFRSGLLQPSILPLLPDITSPIRVTKTVRYVFNRGPEAHTHTANANSFHTISNNENVTVIGVATKPAKIVDCLVQHGCRDICKIHFPPWALMSAQDLPER